MSQLTQEPKNIDRNDEVILNISNEQKTQYLSQNFESGKYIKKIKQKGHVYLKNLMQECEINS